MNNHHAKTQELRLSFEYFPPKSEIGERRFWQAYGRNGVFAPRFSSITYGAGGGGNTRTLDVLSKAARRVPRLPLAGHLTIAGQSRDAVLDIARAYRAAGIEHIVALRGDAPEGQDFAPHEDGFRDTCELIAALKERDFEISVGAYPETHPDAANIDADIAYLKAKFDAGADRALTQFFFEKSTYLDFRARARAAGIDKPIIPGILPIENIENVKRFAARCGASVPAWLEAGFRNATSPEAARLFSIATTASLISDLRDAGVQDFHIYTLNDPNLSFVILTALGLEPAPVVVGSVA